MKSTIKLPRGYLSWSQVNLWQRSKKQYADRYFYGKEGFTNSAMRYGKKFAHTVETGDAKGDELLDLAARVVPRYEVAEYKLTAKLKTEAGDIPLLGFIDTAHDPPSKGLREYKTGKRPWTQKKVDKHGQLTFYALMVYLEEKKLPETMHLDWLETEERRGEISVTGRIETFETSRSIGDILEMTTIVKRTAFEISKAYEEVIQSIL